MSAKTDFQDYLCRTWPVMTTPEEVLELGRQLQVDWEEGWEDRERLEFTIQMIHRHWFRVKSLAQWRLLRDALKMMQRRVAELPKPRGLGFWD